MSLPTTLGLALKMTFTNETFAHFDVCIDQLRSAMNTLITIRNEPNNSLRGPAFRYALVAYASSYNKSHSTSGTVYKLNEDYIPKSFLDLHKRILVDRNQIHAHSDLKLLDIKITFTEDRGQRLVSRSQKGIDGLEELPNLNSIIALVEGTLDSMVADRDRLKQMLK